MIFDIRTRIIGKAQEGLWSADRAEQVAARLGVAPLASEPAPDAFDPMGSPVWTLPMAVVWIGWRDIERVRRAQKSFCASCWRWRAYESRRPIDGGREWRLVKGWELVQPEPATLFSLSTDEALSTVKSIPMLMSVKSAREALWTALEEGRMVAAAIKNETGRPVEIPRHEWTYLKPASDRSFNDSLHFTGSLRPEYQDVTFRRVDLIALWPHDENMTASAAIAPAAPLAPPRQSPQQARVRPILAQLYPQGVPDRASLTDTSLYKAVADTIGADAPSRETVLRAAGRKN